MSFAGTPLGQGRRLDHNTFLGKPQAGARPTSPHRIIPTSYSYGAPSQDSRSRTQDREQDDNDSALAKFAKIKQREALTNRPGGPKIITTPTEPNNWAVHDTSVLLASAIHIAAKNNMLPATNPNNAWSSGPARHNPVVPRSTSVEYEKETQTTNARRLAPPPNRLSRPPTTRKPLSKNAGRHVPESEGEEDTSGTIVNGRGKSPFDYAVDVAKRALGPATYYVRQLSHEPEDRSVSTNGNTSNVREQSYDYSAEEKEFQATQQAKKAGLPANKRGRMSMDNRAYKPLSDVESSEEELSDEKRKRRTKKKNGAVGGPLTTLPVLSADKRKRRRSRGKSGAIGPDDDEESESDEQSAEIESTHAPQRVSVPRSFPAPLSRSHQSIPLPDTMHNSSLESTGLESISEVPEEDILSSPQATRTRARSSSRPAEKPRFSIGGILGRFVHALAKGFLTIIRFVLHLIASVFFVTGRIIGSIYDVALNRPALWLRSTNLSSAAKLLKYLLVGGLLVGLWYSVPEIDIPSHLPSISMPSISIPSISIPRKSSQPPFVPSDKPISDYSELTDRLRRLEAAFSGSQSHILNQIDVLQNRISVESKRVTETELKAKDALTKNVNNVKKDIEVLQAQLLSEQRHRQQAERQHATDVEARSWLKGFEGRVEEVEGELKEVMDSIKKLSTATKSITLKTPNGQDMKALIMEIVDSAISLNNNDGIAKADFAMHSSGARVIPSLTSSTFEIQPPTLRSQIVGLLTGNGYAVGRPPVTALHHETHSGYCWPFSGDNGQLGVSLAAPTIIDEITIDHISKANAVDIRSAPKYMEVWGLVEGQENLEKYRQLEEEKEVRKELGKQAGEDLYPPTLPGNPPYIRIANFTYDVDSPKIIQTFPVNEEIKEKNMDFGIVVLRVLSNWGREDYTCLYRFRVHGSMLGDMPIPEPVEDTGL